ncbi:hypothetical protein AB1N83_012926 [Pleurotus pulmonarius]
MHSLLISFSHSSPAPLPIPRGIRLEASTTIANPFGSYIRTWVIMGSPFVLGPSSLIMPVRGEGELVDISTITSALVIHSKD